MINTSHIPKELQELPQWVGWRHEHRAGKPTKVPYQAGRLAKADTTDPAHRSSFSAALEAMERHKYDGIGFVLDNGWAGLDIDHCRDPRTGELAPWSTDLITPFEGGAYVEASPSGTGVHVIGRGRVPGDRRKTAYGGGAVEMYHSGRFFTVTADVLRASGLVGDITDGLTTVYRTVFPAREPRRMPAALATIVNYDDVQLTEVMYRASNGARIRALANGDDSAHDGDTSKADLVFCDHLASYTQCDAGRMDRMFRSSGRIRAKWDRADYREKTIQKAIERCTWMYDPGRAQTPPPATPAAVDTSSEVAALREEVAALRTEVATLKQGLAEERAARSELVYALRNKAVKTERGTAIAAACILEHKKSLDPGHELPNKGGGWHRVYLDAVAEQAGCSPQRASAHLDRLAEWGVIEKTLQWGSRDKVNRETGEIVREGVKEMYLRSERPLSLTLATLATLEPEKPQTWGGARPKVCPDHPEAGTVKKWTLHCQKCDRQLDEGEDFKRPPTFQDEVSSTTPAPVGVIPSFQDESRGVEYLPGYIPPAPTPATIRNHPGRYL